MIALPMNPQHEAFAALARANGYRVDCAVTEEAVTLLVHDRHGSRNGKPAPAHPTPAERLGRTDEDRVYRGRRHVLQGRMVRRARTRRAATDAAVAASMMLDG
jgi:hypothetical protein